MIQSPCCKCPEKGCGAKHDTCGPYQEWNEKHQLELKAQRAESEANTFKVERIKRFKADKWNGGK